MTLTNPAITYRLVYSRSSEFARCLSSNLLELSDVTLEQASQLGIPEQSNVLE